MGSLGPSALPSSQPGIQSQKENTRFSSLKLYPSLYGAGEFVNPGKAVSGACEVRTLLPSLLQLTNEQQ